MGLRDAADRRGGALLHQDGRGRDQGRVRPARVPLRQRALLDHHRHRLVEAHATSKIESHSQRGHPIKGQFPEDHGIVGNHMYDPDTDEVFSLNTWPDSTSDPMWWDKHVPLWSLATAQGKKSPGITWS